jgi:hypothetical protein
MAFLELTSQTFITLAICLLFKGPEACFYLCNTPTTVTPIKVWGNVLLLAQALTILIKSSLLAGNEKQEIRVEPE